jgi:glutathione synthase
MKSTDTRYLIVADPVEALNPEFDLGVCISTELLARGIAVDYLDLLASNAAQPSERFLATLPVREIRSADAGRAPFWELGPRREAAATEYRVILQRKDPPVDAAFIAYSRHFEAVPDRVVQINRPPATYSLSEHTVILRYPEFAAPTTVCGSFDELVAAVRRQSGEAVLKPKSTCSGIGVSFVPAEAPAQELRAFWEQWQPEVIVQPYLPAIENSGDLRILTINGLVLGSVLRVPAAGSRLANLHQGASAARLEPTPRQLEACRAVAADLNPMGLHLLGLDFIGEHLTEVNFTSPTTIVQINRVNGIRADVELVDELERMWRERAGARPVVEPARRNRLICKGRELPEGWVVVGHVHSPACPGEGDNAWIIKRPGRLEVVAASSPVPAGYSRIRPSRSEHCPGEGDNAWLIGRGASAGPDPDAR